MEHKVDFVRLMELPTFFVDNYVENTSNNRLDARDCGLSNKMVKKHTIQYK